MNRKVTALVPPEIGAANAPGPLALGALLRMPVVDGDYAGRSVPEVRNTSFCAHGKALWPLSCVDRFGNVTVIKRAASLGILEKLAKQLATAAYGLAGQASFVLTGKEMKEVVIPGTLTLSFSLGRFIRESRKRRQDVPRLTAEYLEGWLLLEGTIARKTEKKSGSCHTGTITVTKGNHKLDIWYKGESHLAKFGGRLVAMSPDLICVVRAGTGEPTIHAQLNAGDDVAVIGVRAHKLLRSKAGIEALGPRHWGFDIDYVPIEELVKRKRTSAL